ncbi:5'/3'-nucleotidase SurE [Pseudomonas sp. BN515]|uniref:5'/3'-nucleotidase SurE n=1 Tax=Pseudomonas sp. BN515 TaxID=2567892 RepID=UPI002456CCED|nr:5'/3'-nucleotidase SurE [Pseudomonas sp. BN515]MDH4872743.1 acid phosphatase [Pseudomonas sp. BN515]
MQINRLASLFIVGASLLPFSAQAMNILLSNDDGLSANVKALRASLQAAGHDVILSVPCQNQSGKGASLTFLQPIKPLAKTCVGNAATVGAPGVGAIAGLADSYYVDGTPVMALMYGLDVLAPARWGRAPDLVLSGPNEGQNLGPSVIGSGTVSNAQVALSRAISAIAVSADSRTANDAALASEVAGLTVQLVSQLESRSRGDGLLPAGYGLNVNIPDFNYGESAQLPWVVTRFGNFEKYPLHFVPDLGADPVAAGYGLGDVHLPGVSFSINTANDASGATDPLSETLHSLNGKITLTPMQVGYEVPQASWQQLNQYLRKALGKR